MKKIYNTHQSIKTDQSSDIKNYQPSLSHPEHSTSPPYSPITLTPHCLSLLLTHNSHTTLSLTLTHHIASLTALPSQQIHISSKGFLIWLSLLLGISCSGYILIWLAFKITILEFCLSANLGTCVIRFQFIHYSNLDNKNYTHFIQKKLDM